MLPFCTGTAQPPPSHGPAQSHTSRALPLSCLEPQPPVNSASPWHTEERRTHRRERESYVGCAHPGWQCLRSRCKSPMLPLFRDEEETTLRPFPSVLEFTGHTRGSALQRSGTTPKRLRNARGMHAECTPNSWVIRNLGDLLVGVFRTLHQDFPAGRQTGYDQERCRSAVRR